ncbi:RNA-directed DNA polymerase, eukaryota [Tanacetum coccineum]
MGFHHQNSLQSKLDQTAKISKSVFITNFSEECTSKDLWKVCNDYGTVIDVFIPNKRSKSGKRFAFVRFIKVSNLDRLVENLNTIWMGRFHLSANRARFDRPVVSPAPKQIPGIMSRPKYVQPNAIPKEKVSSPPYLLKPSLVIDDSCLVSRDLDNCVMGEVRQVTSINNMQVLLSNEGFHNTHIVYLGGLWVMIELNSPKAKANLLQHVGVASWFSHIGNAQLDFAAKERIVWVDIEGVPLNAWSHPTFKKIGSIWGEMVDLEEENDTLFARKRICIKTSHMENILESFKLIVKGKVFWVRAKELFTWVPSFKTVPVNEVSLDDESVKANDMDNRAFDNEEESESEVVSDTVFGDYDGDQAAHGPDNQNEVPLMAKATSSDPFNIYGMLNKKTKKGKASKSYSSVLYPPGFTPALNVKANNKETGPVEYNHLSGKSENSNSKVLEEGEMSANSAPHVNSSAVSKSKEGGSILEILEEMITVGQTMGFSMEGCVKDMEKIIGTQGELGETKMENISTLDAKYLWGNYCFDHIVSEACGNSGGIICIWDTNMFKKDNHIISDNFVALYGTWIPNNMKLLLILVYAPQVRSSKRLLWNYLSSLIIRWKGECLVMGDFNEVRSIDERWGSTFNKQGADLFNSFISSSGLIDIQMEGYSFTWAYPSVSKMNLPGFDEMILSSWASFNLDDSNAMIRFKKKLKLLKVEIRKWTKDFKEKQEGQSRDLNLKLRDIDKTLDQGGVTDDLLLSRMELMKQIQDIHKSKHRDSMQKAKVRWAIEGDENSKYFHAIINKKRANLSVKGVMVDGDWVVDPILVKKEFRDHFADRFQDPGPRKGRINFQFPNRLSSEQVADLETRISTDEIRSAVWGCGVDKSPGPDGFTFDFFCKYWTVVGTDFCSTVLWFFDHGEFSIGCNSSFVALIPKILDPKRVCDYRPISLIGCLYKVVTKILASRLSTVISDLIFDVQSAFLPNRQILDGPFIINEAYDSIRWDFLEDILTSFGFGPQWCSWIRGSLKSGKSSILVNGSPTTEFHLFRGLKQGDPIAPFLFLLIMEAFHLSFNRAVEAGTFKGYKFDSSLTLSHLFYADDAVFIGEWSQDNLKGIMHILRCFSILSGMTINFQKSQLLGVGICDNHVIEAAKFIGCSTMKTPFRYLGILVGDNMANLKAWDETIAKMIKRLSKWKLNTHSIGIRRVFFSKLKMAKKIAWIKWTKVLASRNLAFRCFWDLNGEGVFQVKDVRSVLDETFLPKENILPMELKHPVKVNVFVWKLGSDRIPTRLNLMSRNIYRPPSPME